MSFVKITKESVLLKLLIIGLPNIFHLNLNNTMIQFPGPSTIIYLQHNELMKWSITHLQSEPTEH